MTWTESNLRELIKLGGIPRNLADLPALRHLWRSGGQAWSALLHHIADPSDAAALAQRAADPNTAPAELVILAGIFPEVFCRNPVLPLLLLEDPNLPANFDPAASGRLLSHPAVPPDLLSAFVHLGRPADSLAASLHIGIGGECDADWQPALAEALLRIPELPDDDLLAVLTALGAVPHWLIPRIAAADHPRLQAALIAAQGDYSALSQLRAQAIQPRQSESYTVDQLAIYLLDEDPALRAIAAADPRMPPQALAQAKQQEDWTEVDPRVYQALASNPASPPEVLLALAADRSALLTHARRLVALNPNTPDAALTLLADEPYASDIRLILATHPHLAAAERETLRRHSLSQALNVPDPLYRMIALLQADVDPLALEDHIASPFWIERLAVALNPACSPAGHAALADDGNRLVRAAAREWNPPNETAGSG